MHDSKIEAAGSCENFYFFYMKTTHFGQQVDNLNINTPRHIGAGVGLNVDLKYRS